MNVVCLLGRMVKDPELKSTQSGKNFCEFSVAVRRIGMKDEADFINCTAWGKTAELVSKHFSKGGEIGLQGSLRHEKFTKKDGTNGYKDYVIVNSVFITNSSASPDSRKTADDGYTGEYQPDFAPNKEYVPF